MDINTKKIIIKPVITEKTLAMVSGFNKYTFIVAAVANKHEIAEAIAARFAVKVTSVKTSNFLGKMKLWGTKRVPGLRKNYKKAIITLAKGNNIPVFEIK
jgi:large subunit ribosomal protein L23